mmetsp:Transcript_8917/g.26608  ORF Transcript_8917/g.26608 Transcript_8917/m.26608 type:complete len:513 (+) Transcript_8917:2009-3547(+)
MAARSRETPAWRNAAGSRCNTPGWRNAAGSCCMNPIRFGSGEIFVPDNVAVGVHAKGHALGGDLLGLAVHDHQRRAQPSIDHLAVVSVLLHDGIEYSRSHERALALHAGPLLLVPIQSLTVFQRHGVMARRPADQHLTVEEPALRVARDGQRGCVLAARQALEKTDSAAVHEEEPLRLIPGREQDRGRRFQLHAAAILPGTAEARVVLRENVVERLEGRTRVGQLGVDRECWVHRKPLALQVRAVLQDLAVHEEHSRVEVREAIAHRRHNLLTLQLQAESRSDVAPQNADIHLGRFGHELLHRLGGRRVHAIQHPAIEHDVPQPSVPRPVRIAIDDFTHVRRQRLRGGKEHESLQAEDQEPTVGNVQDVPLEQRPIALARRELAAEQRSAHHPRNARVPHNEVHAGEQSANEHSVQELPRQDEDAENGQHVRPLPDRQETPRAPQILGDEARAGKEQQRSEEEPRKVVEQLDCGEEARSAQQRVKQTTAAILDIAHDAIIDHVELQLHVPYR